jgi:hypothetical protein
LLSSVSLKGNQIMKIRFMLAVVCLALAASLVTFGAVAQASPSQDTASAANRSPADMQLLAQFMQGGVGTSRPPRNSEVPLPGSGRRIPVSARDAAADTWQGCQNWTNRFKEPFQRCCRINARGLRSCYDQY